MVSHFICCSFVQNVLTFFRGKMSHQIRRQQSTGNCCSKLSMQKKDKKNSKINLETLKQFSQNCSRIWTFVCLLCGGKGGHAVACWGEGGGGLWESCGNFWSLKSHKKQREMGQDEPGQKSPTNKHRVTRNWTQSNKLQIISPSQPEGLRGWQYSELYTDKICKACVGHKILGKVNSANFQGTDPQTVSNERYWSRACFKLKKSYRLLLIFLKK